MAMLNSQMVFRNKCLFVLETPFSDTESSPRGGNPPLLDRFPMSSHGFSLATLVSSGYIVKLPISTNAVGRTNLGSRCFKYIKEKSLKIFAPQCPQLWVTTGLMFVQHLCMFIAHHTPTSCGSTLLLGLRFQHSALVKPPVHAGQHPHPATGRPWPCRTSLDMGMGAGNYVD